jgi:diguanylate cyclase
MNIRGAPDSSAADRAMYEAKRRGKGGFVIHAPCVAAVSLVPSIEADSGFATERCHQ